MTPTIEKLANATKTYYGCNGHFKAAQNQLKIQEYKQELRRSEMKIPELQELLKIGKFNGEGSY